MLTKYLYEDDDGIKTIRSIKELTGNVKQSLS